MGTDIRTLDLTPGVETLIREAGFADVEQMLAEEDRVRTVPGLGPKRFEAVQYALRMHQATVAENERKAFLGDRAAQADRLNQIVDFLEKLKTNTSAGDRLDGVTKMAHEALRYAELLRDMRDPEMAGRWMKDAQVTKMRGAS